MYSLVMDGLSRNKGRVSRSARARRRRRARMILLFLALAASLLLYLVQAGYMPVNESARVWYDARLSDGTTAPVVLAGTPRHVSPR